MLSVFYGISGLEGFLAAFRSLEGLWEPFGGLWETFGGSGRPLGGLLEGLLEAAWRPLAHKNTCFTLVYSLSA